MQKGTGTSLTTRPPPHQRWARGGERVATFSQTLAGVQFPPVRDRLDEDRRTQPNGPGLSPIWGGLWLASVQIWVVGWE